MWDQRAQRARFLAERYPASREVLLFYAGIAEWQGQAQFELPEGKFEIRSSKFEFIFRSLLDLVIRTAPPALAEAARQLAPSQFDQLLRDYWNSPGAFSPLQFFAR